jgi:predicted dehydrogenase
MNIGLIGCGNISFTYLRLASQFRAVDFVACSDINEELARTHAQAHGIEFKSIDDLLSDPTIDLIVNLTVPAAHAEVSSKILQAGKHVYSEKPFVLTTSEGRELQSFAEKNGLRIGSAPDTFLGGAHQRARAFLDTGELGKVIGGTCHFMNHGMEHWHPNPDYYYQPGGGPMLDMGPYYISNLVQLIGPVKRLVALTSKPSSKRLIQSEPRRGETIEVNTATTVNTLLEFTNGAQVTMCLSWDVRQHEHNCTELYAEHATLHVPDPNFFGGEVRVADANGDKQVSIDHPFSVVNDFPEEGEGRANYRGAGLADMIDAIHNNRMHRCNGELALHVVDIMTSALHSGESGKLIELSSTCERPEAIDAASAKKLLR